MIKLYVYVAAVFVSILISGCVSPVTLNHQVDDNNYATISGGYSFLGIWNLSCGIGAIDEHKFDTPFPLRVRFAPGRHQITIVCTGLSIGGAGGETMTVEFDAISGHDYDYRIFTDSIVDLNTGDTVNVIDVDMRELRQNLRLNLIYQNQTWLPDSEEIIQIYEVYWHSGGDEKILKKATKGALALASETIIFGTSGSNDRILSLTCSNIKDVKAGYFSDKATLTTSDGNKHIFIFSYISDDYTLTQTFRKEVVDFVRDCSGKENR